MDDLASGHRSNDAGLGVCLQQVSHRSLSYLVDTDHDAIALPKLRKRG
jgi:hypothetical protein